MDCNVQLPPLFVACPDHCQTMYPRGTGITGIDEESVGCHIRYIVALNEALAAVEFLYRMIAGLSFVE